MTTITTIPQIAKSYLIGRTLQYWVLSRYSDAKQQRIFSRTPFLFEPVPFNNDRVETVESKITGFDVNNSEMKFTLENNDILKADYQHPFTLVDIDYISDSSGVGMNLI